MGRLSARAVSGGIVLLCWTACSPPPPPPRSPTAFAFAAFGDTPYSAQEVKGVEVLIEEVNAQDLGWVLHVGDILGAPCSDEMYESRLELFGRFEHPFIYTPGDNEWTDCWIGERGEYAPLERLAELRRRFFAQPRSTRGPRPFPLAVQADHPDWPEFVENARWVHRGVVFATVHMVGSTNGREPFPARTEADDAEADRRESAAIAWLEDAFELALSTDAPAAVIAFHAAPGFTAAPGSRGRFGFEAFLAALARESERFARPVLLIHGDFHQYRVDRPLTGASGATLENVTRLEVHGSSQVGWTEVRVDPGTAEPFSFVPHRIALGWL